MANWPSVIMMASRRRLDWLLPSWLENANAYSQSTDEDMVDVGYTLLVNTIILVIFIITFTFVRQSYPDNYFAKKFPQPERTPPPLSTETWFGWIYDFYMLDDDLLLKKGGYDQLFFIRFYRLCFKILLTSCVYCIGVLIPINGTASDATAYKSFDRWSMTNIPQGSWLCWFHLIGICVVSGITIIGLEAEFIVYAKHRHDFLRQPKLHLRTVVVEGIPRKLRSPQILRAYLDLLYPNDVKYVRLGLNIKYLQRLVEERENVVIYLERAMYQSYISHTRPKVKVGKMIHEVDAITHYTQQLESLNNSIKTEQARVRKIASIDSDGNSSFTKKSTGSLEGFLRVTEIKLKGSTKQRSTGSARTTREQQRDSQSRTERDSTFSTDEAEAVHSSYQTSRVITPTDETLCEQQRQFFEYDAFTPNLNDQDDDSTHDEDDEDRYDNSSHIRQLTVSEWFGKMWSSPTVMECWSVLRQGLYEDNTEVALHQTTISDHNRQHQRQSTEDEEQDEEEANESGENDRLLSTTPSAHDHSRRLYLSRAFVTFKTYTAATVAKQVVHMQLAGRMAMKEAPEPTDILWMNMNMTRRSGLIRTYFVNAFVVLLIIIWVAPVTLLSYVFSYDAVTTFFPWLGTLSSEYTIIESLVDMLQPIMLVAIMNLIPPLLMVLGMFEGCLSLSANQFRAFSRYFAFQIVNVFLVATIAGSVIDMVEEIYDSPESAFSLLGSSLPKMGGFFTNYILYKAFTGLGMELIRMAAMFMALFKVMFTPNTTPRDIKALGLGAAFRNMINPGWFPFHKVYAQDMLLFVICATYSCIAPLTILAGLLYFSIATYVYKHQMIYIYESVYETGGQWWPIMARCMVVALLFAQATMAGMFILKATYDELYVLVVLFIVTSMYYFYVASIYTPLANHLPLDMAMSLDQEGGRDDLGNGEDYLQPSIRAGPEHPIVEFDIEEIDGKTAATAF